MNPDYLNQWPESYPVTLDAVREYLYGRPRIGDPASWRRCAEFFTSTNASYGICAWMDLWRTLGCKMDGDTYADMSMFVRALEPNRGWIWPCRAEFAPRRAALCRTVADRLEELQLNPPPANESQRI